MIHLKTDLNSIDIRIHKRQNKKLFTILWMVFLGICLTPRIPMTLISLISYNLFSTKRACADYLITVKFCYKRCLKN